ncbi:MAG TPA: HAMP domain-containing sensor histidine kinase [Gammaproteobacteria bacterium]|nr:HAMP domain-containing sensor histidine kinase [Gammaproteobacteria bacterium]
MGIHNISDIKKSINQIALLPLVIIFCLATLVLSVFNYKSQLNKQYLNHHILLGLFATYQSQLSEKISIIASSPIFLDYLHSGERTKTATLPDFLSLLETLKDFSGGIEGIKIQDIDSNNLFQSISFQDGTVSPDNVTLKLCYLGNLLNTQFGQCKYQLTLYFNKALLEKSLLKSQLNLNHCPKCTPIDFIDKHLAFGTFPILSSTGLKLNLEITKQLEWLIFYDIGLLFLALIIFAFWNRRRVNYLTQQYIVSPLMTLNTALKSGDGLRKVEYPIEEVAYLANELISWQEKYKSALTSEQQAKIGRIASQLAHDIRSPLAALQTIVQDLSGFTQTQKKIIQHVVLRINDIANNLLRSPKSISTNTTALTTTQPEVIAPIIESLVLEKKIQFNYKTVHFDLNFQPHALKIAVNVNPSEFKRVISNLLDNAVESLKEKGQIHISLISDTDTIKIIIADNGCGMSHDLLNKVLNDGISTKPEGHGMGLSHATKCINQWSGQLAIESEETRGTTISITLPIAIKFQPAQPATEEPIIILDDNKVLTETWKLQGELRGKQVMTFNRVEEFLQAIKHYAKNTPIYIDSYLSEDMRGEILAKQLFEQGYQNLYLTTGFEKSQFKDMYWIKEIVGKEPPF